MELKNKVVIVTGSSSNIGQETAVKFAEEGANVVITYRSNKEGAEETKKRVEKNGVKSLVVECDVADQNSVDNLFAKTIEEFGTVDILVNNAGEAHGKDFLEQDRGFWIEEFDSNLFGTVLCSQKAVEIMQKNKSGKILNTSSIRGFDTMGREGLLAYSAAKAGVNSFTKTLAKLVGPDIQVNAVAPGFVITHNYDQVSEDLKKEFIAGTIINRWIQPVEIAEAFIFLAKSDAMTGEVMLVDGGFQLKKG